MRGAARVIVLATAAIVVVSGVLMWVFDHREFPNVWRGMWWAIQTVTTVGYGDVVPKHVLGRVVASFVMLQGIAFLAVLTALITSVFVERVSAEREAVEAVDEQSDRDRVQARFDELDRKLDALAAAVRESHNG